MITKEKLLEDLNKSMDEFSPRIISEPRRCVLSNYFDYPEVIGYFVEFDPQCTHDPASLFIADEPNRRLFHGAYSALHGDIFEDRCLWTYNDSVSIIDTDRFYL